MKKLPTKFIVSRAPKEYLEQGLTQCGAYSVKAILSAYGKDIKKNPRDYQPNILAKYTGINRGVYLWPKVLQNYDVPAQKGDAKNLSDEQRIELLKKSISEDKPVMLRIGNGYLKSGKYNPFRASFMGHWITLWGYNDKEKAFYVYDSYIPIKKHDKAIPIGNTKRTYQEVLRDWGKGFQFRWRYSSITINNKNQ